MWAAIVFATTLVVLAMLWVKISRKISRARRVRRVLWRRRRNYKIKEAAVVATSLLLFSSLLLAAHLGAADPAIDFSLLARTIDEAAEPSEGAVRPVPASSTSADRTPIEPLSGEGAMSCPVGRGLVLLRRAITPVDRTQFPRIIAGAFEVDSGSVLACQDNEQNITSCEGYRNYRFDFYASVALREIGTTEEVIQCEPYDHFKATKIFRAYIVFQENGSTREWRP